ncbi:MULTISPECIES: S26 family signal peptidase [Bradyrhizobium]|jgi:conjugative transfer signal peptidase TraF|uniref:S26 family signal peptidase n=2 Tax=Bradyrhizobium TaxID=374 RepID=A0ABS5GA16_9BRAD|nr:S26 family signal peptidase [Bradyrhizobium denitrificans]MDU1689618.1 S26 family signal peptidase [Bradyrhizobium sp.]MDU6673489.1 S26 family signal peptidase [Bradyrhizobium sp.]MDU6725443.1 S26 family signal peptidase [Bradyrhizobium sp.]
MTTDAVLRLAFIGVAAIAVSAVPQSSTVRLVWNLSASVPTGLYRVRQSGDRSIGEIVAVQPPQPIANFLMSRGYLPRGVPMMKHVAALSGQVVCRHGLAILIDAVEVGQAQERDSRGRPLPVWQGCRTLRDDEAFLMNTRSAISLDGRYFGVLPMSAIVGHAEPLWVSGEE